MGAAPDMSGAQLIPLEEIEVDNSISDCRNWPPGFRFHPTDEELVLYYLKRKICHQKIKLNMIGDVDVYKWHPDELPGKSLLRSGDKQWFFFSPRDRKYPNSSRSNRATANGYWKATGKDRTISQNSKPVGNKKTLVYYHGRAPKGQRTDWVMYEYSLAEQVLINLKNVQDYFVLYKLFRKSGLGPKNGEQYGAPFREEEWDEDVVDDNHMNQTNSNFQMIENPPNNSVDNELPNGDMNANQNHDLDRMLSQVATELDVVPLNSELHSVNNGSGNQVDNNATNERALNLEQNSLPSYDLEDILLQLSNEQDVMHQLPDSTSNAPNMLQGNGARDDDLDINNFMTLSHYINEVPVQQTNAEEEYLEIEDLINSDCQAQNPENMNYNSELNHIGDQFVFPDEYFDTQMFLEDAMGPNSGMNQHNTYWNDFLNNEQQMPASNITTDFSGLEQHFSSSTTSVELCTNVTASSSGVMGANNNNTTESWFDSNLSAFLGSIPSSPAFASENTLLTKALNRVSSFRGGRNKEMRDTYAAVNNNNGIIVRRRRQNGGFLFTSFLVGLGAVVWFLSIGITVQIFKGFWNRYFS